MARRSRDDTRRRTHDTDLGFRTRSHREKAEARFVAELLQDNQVSIVADETEETRLQVQEQAQETVRRQDHIRRLRLFQEEQLRRLEEATEQVEINDELGQESGQESHSTTSSEPVSGSDSDMAELSIDFDAPLEGRARIDRRLQLTNNHPVWSLVRKMTKGLEDISQSVKNTPGIAGSTANDLCGAMSSLTRAAVEEGRPIVENHVNAQLDAEDLRRATERWASKLEKGNKAIALAHKYKGSLDDILVAFPGIIDNMKHFRKLPDASPNKVRMAYGLLKRIDRMAKAHLPAFKKLAPALDKAYVELEMTSDKGSDKGSDDEDDDDDFQSGRSRANTNSTRASTKRSEMNRAAGHTPRRAKYATPVRRSGHRSSGNGWSDPRGGRKNPFVEDDYDGEDSEDEQEEEPASHRRSARRSTRSARPIRRSSFTSQQSSPSRVIDWIQQSQNLSSSSGSSEDVSVSVSASSSSEEEPRPRRHETPVRPESESPVLLPRPAQAYPEAPAAHNWGRCPEPSLGPSHPGNPWNNGDPARAVQQAFSPFREDNHPSRSTRNNYTSRAHFGSPAQRTPRTNTTATSSGGHNTPSQQHRRHHPNAAMEGVDLNNWATNLGLDMQRMYAILRSVMTESFGSPHPRMLNPEYARTTRIWPHIVGAYAPLSEQEAMSYISIHMFSTAPGASQTRALLFGRVMFDYVLECIWDIDAWKCHNPVTDQIVHEISRDLSTSDNTSACLGPIMTRTSEIVTRIMTSPDYQDYRARRISQLTAEMLDTLAPLRSQHADVDAVADGLHALARQAWKISERMNTSGLSFHYFFPQIGSRFYTNTMTPVWPIDEDPQEVQTRSARISLVVSPVITLRNDHTSLCAVHTASFADVICMP